MEGWLTLAGVVFTALMSLAGVVYSNRATRKVVVYRVEQLEKKVEKHNGVIERVYKLEQEHAVDTEKIAVANHRIEDLERAVVK